MATNNRMALLEELRKYLVDKDKDFLREAVTIVVNSLMDSEVSSIIGAEKYERSGNAIHTVMDTGIEIGTQGSAHWNLRYQN